MPVVEQKQGKLSCGCCYKGKLQIGETHKRFVKLQEETAYSGVLQEDFGIISRDLRRTTVTKGQEDVAKRCVSLCLALVRKEAKALP